MPSLASSGRIVLLKYSACRRLSSRAVTRVFSSTWSGGISVVTPSTGSPVAIRRIRPADPDHEELVQVAGEDGHEPDPLQQRHVLVLGQFQHPLVEPEPASLTLDVPVGRQIVGWTSPRAFRRGARAHLPLALLNAQFAQTHAVIVPSVRPAKTLWRGVFTLAGGRICPVQHRVIDSQSGTNRELAEKTRRCRDDAQLKSAQRQPRQAVQGRRDQRAQTGGAQPAKRWPGQPAGGRHSASMATRSPILTRSPRPRELASSASACSTRSQSA